MREKFTEIFVINDQLSELTEKTNKLRQRKIELERGTGISLVLGSKDRITVDITRDMDGVNFVPSTSKSFTLTINHVKDLSRYLNAFLEAHSPQPVTTKKIGD